MLIDFGPVLRRESTLSELARDYGPSELRRALTCYVDLTIGVLVEMSDAEATFIPADHEADDPYAVTEEERHMGWSLVHLVTHVTASAEEGAAFSSLLARGVAIGGRLRSERYWREVTTVEAAIARLEECRRICLAYLDTWPDDPDLATTRIMPEPFAWMKPNAPVSFLFGVMHWHRHIREFHDVAGQARAAAADQGGARVPSRAAMEPS